MSRRGLVSFCVTGLAVCAGSFFLDDPVIGWVLSHENPTLHAVAAWFTKWGDFPPIVAVLAMCLLGAWLLKRPFAIRVILLMLASSIVSGLAANILRILTGRTRPSAKAAPGWYGFRDHGHWIAGQFAYSSFPSAHTAVAIACVVPLWLLLRGPARVGIAIPATLFALCVAASRMLLNAHHLSDVVCSSWLAVVIATSISRRFFARRAGEPSARSS